MTEEDLTPEAYALAREARGTRAKVAKLLNVTQQSLWNRETGRTPVTREAMLALESLPVVHPKTERV